MEIAPLPTSNRPGKAQLIPTATLVRGYDEWLVIGLMIAAVCYQLFLCFLNTKVMRTSVAILGITEAIILAACVPLLVRRVLPGVVVLTLLVGASLCFSSLFSGQINIKAFRDLAIPLCFFWLGCNLGRPELADRALKYVIWIVLTMGFFELLLLDTFTEFFDVYSYYVSTGNLVPITDYVRESKLQLNGMRPEGIGRTLLPGLLGPHRVSSVFLEPVSLGNFATMISAWGLSRDKSQWREGAFFVISAVVLIVLSDSRFALMLVPIMVAMRLVLTGAGWNLAALAPFAGVGLILLMGCLITEMVGDNFSGRLALSGWSLLDFDVRLLLGVAKPPNFGDMGYAYLLSRFGLPLCVVLWFALWLLPMPDERGRRFRAFAAVYIALILSVSGTSLFAFKTASLLWFLMGCLLRDPVRAAAPPFAPIQKPTPIATLPTRSTHVY